MRYFSRLKYLPAVNSIIFIPYKGTYYFLFKKYLVVGIFSDFFLVTPSPVCSEVWHMQCQMCLFQSIPINIPI